ncbi:efflux RND transporter permease subunit, partial [Vibrio alfacsensis]
PILNTIQGTVSVYAERVAGGRYVTIDIKRLAAARYGLNVSDVQQVVSTAVGGMNVGETVEGLERYPINVRYPQDYRDSVVKLQNLPLVTPNGARIALADVAEIRYEDGPPMIKTENARPNGWVFVDIAERDLGSYVTEAQNVVAEQLS